MKRDVIVSQLIKEGFSEKTLVRFSDKQLSDLHERIVIDADKLKTDQKLKDLANDPNTEVEVEEELKGKQKNIDKNHNGKIDAEDFAILNKEKKGEAKEGVNEADMGLTVKGSKSSSSSVFGGSPKKSSSPKKKSTPKKKEEGETEEGEVDESLNGLMLGVIKDKLSKDLGREPENHEIDKAHEDFVNSWKKDNEPKEKKKKGFAVGKQPSPNFNGHKKKEEEKEGNYHNERSEKALEKSKEDFPQLKNVKKCDECGMVESKCKCKKVDIKEIKNIKKCKDCGCTKSECKCKKCDKCDCTKSECKCKKEDVKEVKNWVKGLVENKEFHSFTSKNEIMELIQTKLTESNTMVQHGPKVKKGHNGIPEFMSYDAIVDAEPKTAPSKPAPSTKPGTKPTPTRREDPRKTPFQPGPGENPKPKAKMAEEKKVK